MTSHTMGLYLTKSFFASICTRRQIVVNVLQFSFARRTNAVECRCSAEDGGFVLHVAYIAHRSRDSTRTPTSLDQQCSCLAIVSRLSRQLAYIIGPRETRQLAAIKRVAGRAYGRRMNLSPLKKAVAVCNPPCDRQMTSSSSSSAHAQNGTSDARS